MTPNRTSKTITASNKPQRFPLSICEYGQYRSESSCLRFEIRSLSSPIGARDHVAVAGHDGFVFRICVLRVGDVVVAFAGRCSPLGEGHRYDGEATVVLALANKVDLRRFCRGSV